MSLKLRSFGVQVLTITLTIVLNLFLGVIMLVGRESLIIFGLMVSQSETPVFRFLDKVYLILFGIVWLMAWLWVEGYLSRGIKNHTIWRRFFKLAAVELILLFAAMILMAVESTGGINWTLTLLSFVSLVVGVGILIAQKFKKPSRINPSQDQLT